MLKLKHFFNAFRQGNYFIAAGNGGLEQDIITVSILNNPDIPQGLGKGEFVLISILFFIDNDELFLNFIKNLSIYGAAGAGIKQDHHPIALSASIIQYADAINLPIVMFPHDTVWSDLINTFHHINSSTLPSSNLYHINPAALGSILSSARLGMNSVVRKIADTVHLPVALVNEQKEILYSSQNDDSIEFFLRFYHHNLKEASLHPYVYANFYRGIVRQISDYLPIHNGHSEFLIIVSTGLDFEQEVINLADLISQISGFGHYAKINSRNLYANFIKEIIFNRLSNDEINYMSLDLDLPANACCFIMIVVGGEHEAYTSALNKKLTQSKNFYDTRISHFHQEREDYYYFVIINYKNNDIVAFGHEIRKIMTEMLNFLSPDSNMKLYLGGIYHILSKIKNSFYEAKQSKEFGDILWPQNRLSSYGDIAVFKQLKAKSKNMFLLSELSLIDSYKTEFNFDAIATLEAYLETLNYKKAGERIFVHENTMRYRIQRITDSMHLDFTDPSVTLNFLIKIKLWKLLNHNNMM